MAEVVIIGKSNVGKSTLFNRLVRKRKSIVDDIPGVTRDIVRDVVRTESGCFYLADTGGVFEKPKGKIEEVVKEKVLSTLENADLILFVVDGRKEPTSEDFHIAEILRKYKKKVILIASKVENDKIYQQVLPDIYTLGFGKPVAVSAEERRNIDVLLDIILEKLAELGSSLETQKEEEDYIKVALVGKPNAGKSSIFNAMVGKERAIVTPVPGTTRDSIDELVEFEGKKYLFIDTAGLRRKSRIEERSVEKLGTYRSVDAIERADVVILVVDATQGITRQDQRLAGLAERKGKATIVVYNKWDLVESKKEKAREFLDQFYEKLYFVDYSPVLFTSAVEGWGLDELFPTINEVYKSYTMKVPTSKINNALEKYLLITPPPSKKGKKLRIYFGMQVDVKPPTFLFFSNRPADIPESYTKSLRRMIREEVYPFVGCPVFIKYKRSRK